MEAFFQKSPPWTMDQAAFSLTASLQCAFRGGPLEISEEARTALAEALALFGEKTSVSKRLRVGATY